MAGSRSAARPGARRDHPSKDGTRPKSRRPVDEQDRARRDLKRQAAAHDRKLQAAYQAGEAAEAAGTVDEGPDGDYSDEERQAWQSGVDEARSRAAYLEGRAAAQADAATSSSSPAGRPRRPPSGPAGRGLKSVTLSHDGAGLLLGLFGYAIGISYLRYGWPGVTSWLSAKFLNKPTLPGSNMPKTLPAPPKGSQWV